ncbi:ornithine cyclodeaminase [Chryseobacterium polytrichastri]|uniref:Ornithine cyclodeaminase n=2 Tax=Chryseobacterium polytrichastri TaxID=1302687 RepID=A0A1M6UVR8_9FLAO|nr:ornithine cyclodeaminase [Chryseobacterium polytrichastri]
MVNLNSSSKVLTEDEIHSLLPNIELLPLIEKAFTLYSNSQVQLPPVTELNFENPSGDVHIKCASVKEMPYYVVKIASGFYENPGKGISSSQGLMLLFDSETGCTSAVLLDNGYLTDVRTGLAGAVCAKYLAPKNITQIGIVGAGIQAQMQLKYLKTVTACRKVSVWARSETGLKKFLDEIDHEYWDITSTNHLQELAENSNLIVTTTPSQEYLLRKEWIKPGTHITAVGSDTPHKIELDPALVAHSDLVVVDSIEQCKFRGELYQMYNHQLTPKKEVVELGKVIRDRSLGRKNDTEITIADLTGIATQDLMIAQGVYETYLK